ncbi:MAG: hypothetical protein ACSLFB_10995 [Acidimicrobiales bacterium]
MTIGLTMNEGLGLAIVLLVLVVAVLIVVALLMAIKTMDSLRRNIEDLRQSPSVMSGDQYVVFQQGLNQQGLNQQGLHQQGAIGRPLAVLERGNDPIWSDRPMTAGIEAASRLAYLTFSSPIIKTIALGSGTLRAVRSFRRG